MDARRGSLPMEGRLLEAWRRWYGFGLRRETGAALASEARNRRGSESTLDVKAEAKKRTQWTARFTGALESWSLVKGRVKVRRANRRRRRREPPML